MADCRNRGAGLQSAPGTSCYHLAMLSESGATRTLDLTVAPPKRGSAKLIWLALIAVSIGGAWAVFFRDGGSGGTSRPAPPPGARLEQFSIAGRILAVRVAEDWRRLPQPGGVAFELPVPGDGTVKLTFAAAEARSARANMEQFLATDAVGLEVGLEVVVDRFRWLDMEDGLGVHEIVIGESDARHIAGGVARQRRRSPATTAPSGTRPPFG